MQVSEQRSSPWNVNEIRLKHVMYVFSNKESRSDDLCV